MTHYRMCWNKEVSLLTGFTATLLSIYLLLKGKGNDIPVALVSLMIALMQFAEAFLWSGNQFGHRLAILALFGQPLALLVGIWFISGLSNTSMVVLGALWCTVGIPTMISLMKKDWPIQPGCQGHLQWPFLEPMLASPFGPFYWLVMFGAWFLFKPFQEGLEYSVMAIGTWAVTWWLFPGEWGSLWCFVANLLPLGRLL